MGSNRQESGGSPWENWFAVIGGSIAGAAIPPVGREVSGGRDSPLDVPVTTGYTIVGAHSMADAEKLLVACAFSSFEIHETMKTQPGYQIRLGEWYQSCVPLETKRHLAGFVVDVPLLEEGVGAFGRFPLGDRHE
ncbi:MAG TPA: hypothetical protein VLA54_11610 [Acidimicrobiia bacterium]|nr:hypothetical protein [Acidimicrobiia bacterium]